MTDGFCSECGEPANGKWEDNGIGSYEYFGARGHHVDWRWGSECCGADMCEDAALTVQLEPPDESPDEDNPRG